MSLVREFLGWERSFLGLAVDWLLADRDALPATLVVVPTAQSGRRLRQALAEAAGACLAPRVRTAGSLLRPAADAVAGVAEEVLAWVEVLERLDDWASYAAAFPVTPGHDELPGWSASLAKSLAGLRRSLHENALTLAGAARRMDGTVDRERWLALAALEERVEQCLAEWGVISRSRALADGLAGLPDGIVRVVLAGVADLPPAVVRMLRELPQPVIALVGAPELLENEFDDIGRPLAERWNQRALQWPGDAFVEVAADVRQQAQAAVRRVAEAGTASSELALGTADVEAAGELVRAFGRAGWIAHDPSHEHVGAAAKWLGAWRRWLAKPDAGTALDLLGFAATASLVGGRCAQKVYALSAARDRWLVSTADDLERKLAVEREDLRESLSEAIDAMRRLEAEREEFLREGTLAGLARLLSVIAGNDVAAAEFLADWLERLGPVAAHTRADAGMWLDLLLDEWPPVAGEAPDGRVVDVQGWLELLHEPGRHLVLCGMNDGNVPAGGGNDAWLSESTRARLGLTTEAIRAARDAFLFTAMIESRRSNGRVDVLLTKTSAGGDALLPSRLLLAADTDDLPRRVRALFREVEPPDAGLAWTADFRWAPRVAEPRRIGVTALRDYLACPYRFYLKQVLGMNLPDPERKEWNSRDFGIIVHAVLEAWGRDETARDFSKSEAIEEWTLAELDRMLDLRFGNAVPLAVRIQTESIRQRLRWFARVQACERAAGWRVENVEYKYQVEIAGSTLVGRIDRVDIHADGRCRLLDYKTTATVKDVESDHRKKITAATKIPAHLEGIAAAICPCVEKGGEVLKLWHNLQVPLYSTKFEDATELGYFGVGASEEQVKLSLWENFGERDRQSAVACAEWVLGQIAAGVFWPPNEMVRYDDFELLAAGKSLAETAASIAKGGAA